MAVGNRINVGMEQKKIENSKKTILEFFSFQYRSMFQKKKYSVSATHSYLHTRIIWILKFSFFLFGLPVSDVENFFCYEKSTITANNNFRLSNKLYFWQKMLNGATSHCHNSARHKLPQAILNYTAQWLLLFPPHDKISTVPFQNWHKLQNLKISTVPLQNQKIRAKFGTTTIKFFNLIDIKLFDWKIKQKLENQKKI